MTAQDDVRAALDSTYRSVDEIHEKVGCWSHMSIRNRLADLYRAGEAERVQIAIVTGFMWVYRRRSDADQTREDEALPGRVDHVA